MKKKTFVTTLALLFFVVCYAVTIDISGKWTGILKMKDGHDMPLNYTFKVDSDKLTGTALTPQGEVKITDGMINGNDFSFNVPVPNGNAPHTGKIYADSLTLHIVYKGEHLAATLKRSN
ncbi:hypothetical protein SAMN05216464_10535 [Mucilaginibacter pineti]|uniref:Glycoside hydrolase n=1 Tax=Mucilaginibacter pineti TaxID=1391627 RepID=A0A1G7BI38_9SPHI|nr:hypothetical protein [Mucilaginibacter pineti]SDE26699.1 hypothetical protein SAMN05216464_10535 [Mucilaginibacter pineti]